MAARKATSRPRTARSRKTKKTPAARKRSTRPARGRRAITTRTATPKRRPSRRAKAAKRPAAARKAAATRRKKVVARPKSAPVKRKATATTRKKATPTRRPVRKSTARRVAPSAPAPKAAARKPAPVPRTTVRSAPAPVRPAVPPALVRERRQLAELERDDVLAITAADDRLTASVRSGREELKALLGQHHETSPVLTAGDVDAKWTDAYAVGDEAPGGDNPTPDQDRVDDIGKALGVNYEANEELRGSEKITDRDRHRWELDPASSDDWPHDKE